MKSDLKQFDELKASVAILVSPTMTMTVTSLETSQRAVDACKQVKAYIKEIETKRKELTDPLLAEQRRIKAYADDLAGPLERAEDYLKNQIAAYHDQQEVIRAAERKKAEEMRLAEEAKAQAEAEALAQELMAKQAKDRAREEKAAAMFGGDVEGDDAENAAPESIDERQAKEYEELQMRLDQEAASRAAAAKQREWDIRQQGVKGIKKPWNCDLLDINLVPDAYVIKTLNKAMVLAAARGGTTSIPGVRLFQETSVSIGAKTYVPRAAIEKERAGA